MENRLGAKTLNAFIYQFDSKSFDNMGNYLGMISGRSVDRGTRQLKNLAVEWYNRDGLTASQIARIDKSVFGAIDYYFKLLRNDNYRMCLFCLNEGKILSANPDMPIGMQLIYVKNESESGQGSAGTRGFTLYAGTANLHYNQGGESTPPYAAIHELHHVLGSRTEFDTGSLTAYEGYVLSECINDPSYSNMKNSLTIGAMGLLEQSQKDKKWYKNRLVEHEFLHKQYPSKYITVLKHQGFSSANLRALLNILE